MVDELPIYTVTSSNWSIDIQMDEHNAALDLQHQIMEAGTRAVEIFKGMRGGPELKMFPDYKDEEPYLGTTILIHPVETDPEEAAIVFTHVCLANMGLYKESVILSEVLEKQITALQEKQLEEEEKKKDLNKSIKSFDALKKEMEEKSKKAPKIKKKKKPDNLN
jgi:hypothetical protein